MVGPRHLYSDADDGGISGRHQGVHSDRRRHPQQDGGHVADDRERRDWLLAAGANRRRQLRTRSSLRQDRETFVLDPATFAPPIVKRIVVGYTVDRTAAPDSILTYNDFTFAAIEKPVGLLKKTTFAPFTPTADARPTLYLGFELPSAIVSFPNRPVSFYARAADVRYGDQPAPVWPSRASGAGAPGTVVTHHFTITNPDPTSTVNFDFTSLGTAWTPAPTVPGGMTLGPGASAEAAVSVTVPQGQGSVAATLASSSSCG